MKSVFFLMLVFLFFAHHVVELFALIRRLRRCGFYRAHSVMASSIFALSCPGRRRATLLSWSGDSLSLSFNFTLSNAHFPY